MTFTGFSDQAFTFYEGLVADNSRIYWQAHKAEFEQCVREPLRALLDELDEWGPFHIFRPHRDVRFAKDKTPYKDHIGAYGESQGGAGHYVQFSHAGMFAGSGYYDMAGDQLQRFREAVDSDAKGTEIADISADLASAGYELSAIGALKTAPRGYPKDHPRIELLRRKGLVATVQWKPAAWMRTRAVVKRVREAWQGGAAMNEWLDLHVGPSTQVPDEGELARFGPL